MLLLPAAFFVLKDGRIEVPVHNRRPSAVLASLKGLKASLVAYDDRAMIGVSGSPEEVAVACEVVRLADVPRKPILLRVTVESPVDHLTWEVDARLTSGQRWRTSDEETGAEVALEPRIDADGTLTVKVLARCAGDEATSLVRLKKGKSSTLVLGSRRVRYVLLGPGSDVKVEDAGVPLPKVTVRYVGG